MSSSPLRAVRCPCRAGLPASFAAPLLLLAAVAAAASATPVPPPASGPRDRLGVDELSAGRPPGIVHNGYFQPVGEAGPARHRLCGTLRFAETRMVTSHPDEIWMGGARSRGVTSFPGIAIPVVTHDGWLIPLWRDLILTGEGAGAAGASYWNAIANPGRVWQEPTDAGYARAAFPLTLTDNYIGQARNALVSFVFDDSEISPAAVRFTDASDYEIAPTALAAEAYRSSCR